MVSLVASLGALIPQLLVERGVDTVFGIPGVHTVEMYRGMPGSGLTHHTPRHEQGAGFMADGYYRATGKVAACFIITGPGMTNIATAMGQAYGDSIPMLVISSVNAEAHIGRGLGRLHEMKNQQALVEGVCAWSRQVRDGAELAEALDDAMDLFATERPRPVHIQIPIDRLSIDAGDVPAPRPRAAVKAPGAAAFDKALGLLNRAVRPVLVLGGGATRMGAETATKLADALGAATLMTSNAKGLLPHDHSLNAGGMLFGGGQRDLLRNADVVLSLGAEFGDTEWTFYTDEPPKVGGTLIRVDIDPAQLDLNIEPDLAIQADATEFAEALLRALNRPPAPAADLSACAAAPSKDLAENYTRHLPMIEALWAAHPDAILVGDSAEPSYTATCAGRAPGSRQWFTGSTGFGTLGYALPAAIGAQIARPDAPVIALAGDGGALYTIAELAAAAEANAPVILLIWNNDGYGEIRTYMQSNQIQTAGVDLSPIDFAALAKGFGAGYAAATDIASLLAAVGAARGTSAPTVIEIKEHDWCAD